MRFMVIVKASEDFESGRLPSREELAAMDRFNEELARAGVMLAAEGSTPAPGGSGSRTRGTDAR
jgi:hypothetical protein